MKRCTNCNVEKSTDEFHKQASRSDGLRAVCKDCRKLTDCTADNQRRWMLKYTYGITVEEYEALLAAQDGKCAVEGCTAIPEEQRYGWFVVDHDHATGTVRGLLCNLHNVGLGAFHDDPSSLRAAADYLERSCQP